MTLLSIMAPKKAKEIASKAAVGKFAKSISKQVAIALKRPAAAIESEPLEDETVLMKKPAVAKRGKTAAADVSQDKEHDIVAQRTKELKAMPAAELKDFVKTKGLEAGNKADMITAVLDLEARLREEAKARAAKSRKVLADIQKDIASKSASDLKDLCAAKGLKLGGSKDERVARLVEKAQADGEVERVLANMAREDRRALLTSMDKSALSKLCNTSGVDPLVKEVMVERLLQIEMP